MDHPSRRRLGRSYLGNLGVTRLSKWRQREARIPSIGGWTCLMLTLLLMSPVLYQLAIIIYECYIK